jgi:hypothetical protein
MVAFEGDALLTRVSCDCGGAVERGDTLPLGERACRLTLDASNFNMITREAKRKLRVPLRTFSFRGGLLAYLEALKVGVARLQKRLLMLLVYLESEG